MLQNLKSSIILLLWKNVFQIPVGDAKTHFSGCSSRTRLDLFQLGLPAVSVWARVYTHTHTHTHTHTLNLISRWVSRDGERLAQMPVGELDVRSACSRLDWVRRRNLEEGGAWGCGVREQSWWESGEIQRVPAPLVMAVTEVAAQDVSATLARVPAQAYRCVWGDSDVLVIDC